ncbi:hypothetical protein HKCCE3408_15710 [Rhodobacterales bacterium HKCCE3408]|nr:hypothetical protein [Rhodobacterales bacterium HKCCE3408]
MSHRFDIHFPPLAEREAATHRLTRVLTPVDDFTGDIVTSGVTAVFPWEDRKARRSLSGHLVFEDLLVSDLADPGEMVFEMEADRAGYFSPGRISFPVHQDLAPLPPDAPQAVKDARRRIREVRLIRRPDCVIDGESAVIRGGVRREGAFVDAVAVEGRIDGFARIFRTRTDARGSFALRLQVPPDGAGDPLPKALVTLTFRLGAAPPHEVADIAVTDLATTTIDIVDLPDP